MPAFHEVYIQYQKLCIYSDNFWHSVSLRYAGQIHCTEGCSGCCEIQSVNALEAAFISLELSRRNYPVSIRKRSGNKCVFLNNNRCEVYENRPLICRTHGILLKNSEQQLISTCSKNFTDSRTKIEDNCILNADMLTMNLMRLNMAFCMISQKPELASSRFHLSDIISGNVPQFIKDAPVQ